MCVPGPGYTDTTVSLGFTNFPVAAANGWAHMVIPINQSLAGINAGNGIVFHKWCSDTWALQVPVTAKFWIDNVVLQGTASTPPPQLSAPIKPAAGLNVFASTAGLYDRQEVLLVTNRTGLSWVGHATAENPVTYSFTITNYPQSQNCEAYFFLSPNSFLASAPDWNDTNCAIFYLQGGPQNATVHFQYKVNEDNDETMPGGGTSLDTHGRGPYTNAPGSWDGITTPYYESGNLASATNNGVLGTWILKFTSNTAGQIITPNGNHTNFTIPSYNVGYFAESSSFDLYLGMQANNADAINQAVVYADFAVSGVPSAYSDNFMADTVLDTNAWSTSQAPGPKGVLIVPASAASGYWARWSLPATGFSLQTGGSLTSLDSWTSPSAFAPLPVSGYEQQLVPASELPGPNLGFFNVIKRQFSQLQILFPGESNAPGTLTGKVGTPTPVGPSDLVTFTVNAVDSSYHIISTVTDTVSIYCAAPDSIFDNPKALSGGTATFNIMFGDTGSQTVTATDTTTATIPEATSSPITVQ